MWRLLFLSIFILADSFVESQEIAVTLQIKLCFLHRRLFACMILLSQVELKRIKKNWCQIGVKPVLSTINNQANACKIRSFTHEYLKRRTLSEFGLSVIIIAYLPIFQGKNALHSVIIVYP